MALSATSPHFDPYASGYKSVRTSREQKCLFIFSCADFTASFDSDKVLSAGDMGCNLFMFNAPIFEGLSNKSAKSTHTPDIHPTPVSGNYFLWGEPQAQEVLRISSSPQRLAARLLAGNSYYLLSPALSQTSMWRRYDRSGLFGTSGIMDPGLFPEIGRSAFLFFIFLLKSQAVGIRSAKFCKPESTTSIS